MARKHDSIHDSRGNQRDDRPHRAQLLWTFMVAISVGATAFHQLGAPRSALLQDSRTLVTSGPSDMAGMAQRPLDATGYMDSPSSIQSGATAALQSGEKIESLPLVPAPKTSRKVRHPSSK